MPSIMRSIMQTTKWIVLGASLIGVTACMERVYRHRYISLEQVADISVEKTARLELEGLFCNVAVPVEYRLARERYVLRFTIAPGSYDPSIRVAVIGNSSLSYHPSANTHAPNTHAPNTHTPANTHASNGAPCAGAYTVDEHSFDFGWAGECGGPQRKVIEFDVIDSSGAIIGTEHIAFTIENNGYYHATDAL